MPSCASSRASATRRPCRGPARARRARRRHEPRSGSARPRARPRCGRTRSQPPDTTSVRTPWTASGWTNATSSPNSPRRGVVVDQLRAGRGELAQRRRRHRRPRARRGACPGPRRARNRPTGVSSPVGARSSIRPVADEQRGRLDALLRERVAVLDLRAEETLVGLDRPVEVGDGDAEMVDSAQRHARDAIREADVASSVAHGKSAHRRRSSRTSATPALRPRAAPRARRGRASPSRAAPRQRGRATRGASLSSRSASSYA